MRDLLTGLAVLLILLLGAALVAPPFIDWSSWRPEVERALARAAGVAVKTEGPLSLRLLPTPRIAIDNLTLGEGARDSASLVADGVVAEIELTPLLGGEVRFIETRIGRAEIKVPAVAPERWRLPAGLSLQGSQRNWTLEDLSIGRLVITASNPVTGRTDQYFAESITIRGDKLAGPWRAEGMTGGAPFRLVTGELTADEVLQVKLTGGGDHQPRYDIDARIEFSGSGHPASLSGTARVAYGPPAQAGTAGIPVPIVIQSTFRASGEALVLEPLTIDAGDGQASIRLAGTGRFRLDRPHLALNLEGRRLDLDALLATDLGRDLSASIGQWQPPRFEAPVELDLALQHVALGGEEIADIAARLSLVDGRLGVTRAAFVAPGQTRVLLSGNPAQGQGGTTRGRVTIASAQSPRFLRYLGRLGIGGSWTAPFAEAQRFDLSGLVDLGGPVATLSELRLGLGDAQLTGSARYRKPSGAERIRARLEAELAIQGYDLADLPQAGWLSAALAETDIGLTIEATRIRYGNSAAGRIRAKLSSDGPAIVLETLEIADLAGASARLSGRIAPDGSGRIAGRVTAPQAAPLLDLYGSLAAGGIVRLVPPVLREGPLDLEITTERAGPATGPSGLRPTTTSRDGAGGVRTTARGNVGGGRFEADMVTADGVAQSLAVTFRAEDARALLRQPDVATLARPAALELKGSRISASRYAMTLSGDLAGLRIATMRPFALGLDDDSIESGEADLTAADLAPFLPLLGLPPQVGPALPTQLRLTIGRDNARTTIAAGGRIAQASLQARLSATSRNDLQGALILDRLSVPWLASILALGPPVQPPANPGANPPLWSNARFGATTRPAAGEIAVDVRELDLGGGRRAENAKFKLALTGDGFAVRDLQSGFLGGRLNGGFAFVRQGARVTLTGEGVLIDARLAPLVAGAPFEGKLAGNFKFAGAGDTPAALVANLSGSGEWRLADLVVQSADPRAVERVVTRALDDSDPLAPARLEAFAAEELSRGPLRAAAATANATIVGGAVRLGPLALDGGVATWQGTVSFDLKNAAFEAKGLLGARAAPKGWTGTPPALGVNWSGRGAPASRQIEVGPLATGLAAIVLKRELDKIEAFEADQHERSRVNQQREMERVRERERRAAEEALLQARLREEEAERARQRARAEAERQARLRAEREREAAERARLQAPAEFGTPLDIRPQEQFRLQPRG